jgi:hypothetical protein
MKPAMCINAPAQFAIGSRKSKIANVVVPVIQRIEQGFHRAKRPFLQQFADVLSA